MSRKRNLNVGLMIILSITRYSLVTGFNTA